jgi:hypothetical protein
MSKLHPTKPGEMGEDKNDHKGAGKDAGKQESK